MVELYEQLGVDLGVWRRVSELDDLTCLSGKIVLAPPSALADRWSQKLPNVMACMASGWMQIGSSKTKTCGVTTRDFRPRRLD